MRAWSFHSRAQAGRPALHAPFCGSERRAMDIKSELLEGIGARIKEIMYGYVARQSVTCTPRENTAAEYFTDFFDGTAYFSAHPAQNGVIRIDGDPLDRS